jgi:hypothetical protein
LLLYTNFEAPDWLLLSQRSSSLLCLSYSVVKGFLSISCVFNYLAQFHVQSKSYEFGRRMKTQIQIKVNYQ